MALSINCCDWAVGGVDRVNSPCDALDSFLATRNTDVRIRIAESVFRDAAIFMFGGISFSLLSIVFGMAMLRVASSANSAHHDRA